MEDTSEILSGYLPQLENQSKHRDFLRTVPSIDTVVIKITAARALANRGITAEDYGGNCKVITTTTIDDRVLQDLDWKNELEIVKRFNPHFHIPADCPTYRDKYQTTSERNKNLNIYLEGLLYMDKHLENVELIPLIKGEYRHERLKVKDVLNHLSYDYAVFYATQMMISGTKHYRVIGKINQVANLYPEKEVIVMGMQVPRYLEQLASNVVAVSGQKWRRVADPTEHRKTKIVSNYRELAEDIEEGLERQEQSSLFRFDGVKA